MAENPALEAMKSHVGSNQPVAPAWVEEDRQERLNEAPDAPIIPEIVQADYFGFVHEERHTLPDGVSWVAIKKLNEGDRRAYQNASSRRLTVRRQGEAEMKMAAGDEKHQLLMMAIVNWNLRSQGSVVPFSKQMLDRFLTVTDPMIVDDIEAAVRRLNPWLDGDVTIEQIDKEIEALKETRERLIKEQEGKGTSANQ